MSKKERKLTPAELKRKENFEKLCVTMEEAGYQRKDLIFSVVAANAGVFAMIPFAIAAFGLFLLLAPEDATHAMPAGPGGILFLFSFLVLIVVHELIHGLTWGIFAKEHFKSIEFGVIWQMLTPYCTCSETLTKRQYLLGAAMPTLLLGFLPAVVAAVLGSVWLLILSVFMMFGGGGDFLIILKILFFRPQAEDVRFYDHPYECGVVAFVK